MAALVLSTSKQRNKKVSDSDKMFPHLCGRFQVHRGQDELWFDFL